MDKHKENIFLKNSSGPGLLFIQIDGFSKTELEQALERNEMPFLKKLLSKENYRLYSLYPGLPSTTPSVQGELFYGVKQIVPAFFFMDKKSRKMFKMFDSDSVQEIQKSLSQQGKGLLEGGSSYANIYTGGAKEAHFCAASLGLDAIRRDINIKSFFWFIFTHFIMFARMALLCLWETVLALMDFVYAVVKKENLIIEAKFVFLRVMLCIWLRELVTFGAILDVYRGLPIIHLNYLGYDEQAHRRQPGSPTAHWALKGIDASIKRIYYAALRASKRHYDLWVYSDHGQEATIPYIVQHGRSVEEAVEGVFCGMFADCKASKVIEEKDKDAGIQLQRARYLGPSLIQRMFPAGDNTPSDFKYAPCVTTAMGPVGHVYLFKQLIWTEKETLASKLISSAKIPLVLYLNDKNEVQAMTERGKFILPGQGREILNSTHPFYEDVINDLVSLCHHPQAGDFVISGWVKDGTPQSFPYENGAHAGPGEKETDAFALVPSGVIKLPQDGAYLKIMDLREAALKLLKRSDSNAVSVNRIINPEKKTIRIMTYNVHSCIGMDGKVSTLRIARVINQYKPDIVALQELDHGRRRTGHMDQPHLIAKELEMFHHFYPAIQVEEEQYGNAVLSRYPMDLVCAMKLPKFENKLLEPRGAIWVSINVGETRLQIINAHLSFYGPERRRQIEALMSPEWIGHNNCASPAILCGDFNCLPKSAAWHAINNRLKDAQFLLDNHRPLPTWFGHYPIGRIDHVFVSSGIKVLGIQVPKTQLNKLASDHLPLIVDLEVIDE